MTVDADEIIQAARTLISATRADESGRFAAGIFTGAELTVQVDVTGGGIETWIIGIELVESKQ